MQGKFRAPLLLPLSLSSLVWLGNYSPLTLRKCYWYEFEVYNNEFWYWILRMLVGIHEKVRLIVDKKASSNG